MAKNCESCSLPAVMGERYCRICRRVALKKMQASGYLDGKSDDGEVSPEHDDSLQDAQCLELKINNTPVVSLNELWPQDP